MGSHCYVQIPACLLNPIAERIKVESYAEGAEALHSPCLSHMKGETLCKTQVSLEVCDYL